MHIPPVFKVPSKGVARVIISPSLSVALIDFSIKAEFHTQTSRTSTISAYRKDENARTQIEAQKSLTPEGLLALAHISSIFAGLEKKGIEGTCAAPLIYSFSRMSSRPHDRMVIRYPTPRRKLCGDIGPSSEQHGRAILTRLTIEELLLLHRPHVKYNAGFDSAKSWCILIKRHSSFIDTPLVNLFDKRNFTKFEMSHSSWKVR